MLTFHKNYFGWALLLLAMEVLIALFVRDPLVRPYLGDVLVVILLYCFFKAFLRVPVYPLAWCVLFFAGTLEFLQYLRLVEKLGLEKSTLARTLLGTSFAWLDLLAYLAGTFLILLVEKWRENVRHKGTLSTPM
ncbi:DUF2809 domain-containing protein [Rhabdobacter roseus]|uniref:DUF2809 domain-containing protein n=1 Tax=Rhabdobacter roseus TaxID=1655419 RepID=A0A840TYF5_9BACT|nr:DUF2809 domain-containing protein [Rhabdobacter roseus]MBB5286642.1 hypothetical protein [Rhabdobacter roseus]